MVRSFTPALLLSSLLLVLLLAGAFGPAGPAAAQGGPAESAVSGTVFVDQDRNDQLGAADRPLAGYTVRISGGGVTKETTIGPDGRYAFDKLPAATYTIVLLLPSDVFTAAPTRTLTLDGRRRVGLDFLVSGPRPIPTSTPAATPVPGAGSARASGTPTATGSPGPSSTQAASGAPAASGTPATPVSTLDVTPSATVAGAPQTAAATGLPGNEDGAAALETDETATMTPTGTAATPTVTTTATPTAGATGTVTATPRATRPSVASLQGLRYAPGRDGPTAAQVTRQDGSFWLGVPFISQLDGTTYAEANCGPASTAMAIGAFGVTVSPSSVRDYVNYLSGVNDPDEGTSLVHLSRVVREAGLHVSRLYDGNRFERWTVDMIREEVRAGRPVVTLVHYRALPGHSTSEATFDHYITISGLSGDDFIYNDAAYVDRRGFGLLISPADIEQAWAHSSIPRHGMAVGLGGNAPRQPSLFPSAQPSPAPLVAADAADRALRPTAEPSPSPEPPETFRLPGTIASPTVIAAAATPSPISVAQAIQPPPDQSAMVAASVQPAASFNPFAWLSISLLVVGLAVSGWRSLR